MSFDHDVFISYARVDDGTVDGDPEAGWVTRFHKHLSVTLARKFGDARSIRIWRDARQISGNQLFDLTIQEAIQRSAVFLALTSPGYVRSDYCRRELEEFFKKAQRDPVGLAVGDNYRIFNVRLNNLPPSEWPPELGRAAGFRFHDSVEADNNADTLEPDSQGFLRELKALAQAVYKTLCRLKEATASHEAPQSEDSRRVTVFLAETTEALDIVRKRIGRELEESKAVRVAARVPPPLEAEAHDDAVRASLGSVDLSVHVLDGKPGREMCDREGSFYPQRQVELALAHGKSQLMLIPQSVTPESIEDPGYGAFLERLENGPRAPRVDYHVQRGLTSDMSRQILEHIAQLKARRTAPGDASMGATLLDTHVKDQLHAFELGQYLMKRQVQTLINPQEDDPGANHDFFTQRLRKAGILIVFYGAVPWEWVRERLRNAVQIACSEEFPEFSLRACGVYMAPPLTSEARRTFPLPLVSLEWMDHTRGFDARAVDRLLARAQAAGSPM